MIPAAARIVRVLAYSFFCACGTCGLLVGAVVMAAMGGA